MENIEGTLLETIAEDNRTIISRYIDAVSNVANSPFTIGELGWLFSVRREIIVTHFRNDEYFTGCSSKYYRPGNFLVSEEYYRCRSEKIDTYIFGERSREISSEYAGESIDWKNDLLDKLSSLNICGYLPRKDLKDILIFDVKSIFMIFRRRFFNLSTSPSIFACLAIERLFSSILNAYQGEYFWFQLETYLFTSIANMEIDRSDIHPGEYPEVYISILRKELEKL